ncbi:MAG: signal recognition particle protein [Chlamydiae bacterium RIFCSPHIGHO2_12_FULL_49_11]|nr:MAG: signal recognition particle protein [Chlamydiae bacterium RIFCSPHIGHO2_12_FULL_49_11]
MFESISQKFLALKEKLRGRTVLSEEEISSAAREVRLALLDADVSYPIVSGFIKRVKEKAAGSKRIKGVDTGDQFIHIVHEELVSLMGSEEPVLNLSHTPTRILLAGLQGSGKTTTAAKMARYFALHDKKRVLLVALDLKRPAAIEQLRILGKSTGTDVFSRAATDPCIVVQYALRETGYDVIIFDSAGRLAVDGELMQELAEVKKICDPQYTLFVANSHLGQDAVNTARTFAEEIGIDGSILTMLDGASRAGAALSIREASGKPLYFEGVGEHLEDLQPFNAKSMADRILGMGDVVNLVRKAKIHIDEKQQEELKKKFLKAAFTYDDYLKQMAMMRRMGSFKSLFKMLPGEMRNMIDEGGAESNFKSMEAMILSMTLKERSGLVELEPSRRRRIALGSGKNIEDVNRLVKDFKKLKQFSKQMPKMKKHFNSTLM